MSDFNRVVVLSTGVQWPLMHIAGCLGLLESKLSRAEDRQLVYNLRRVCLGVQVSASDRQALRDAALLEQDDSLDPIMKDVVLASVRGEDFGLHLVSPFTSSWDRTLYQLVEARDRIRAELPPEQAEHLLTHDPLDSALQAIRRSGKWTSLLTEQAAKDPSVPTQPDLRTER